MSRETSKLASTSAIDAECQQIRRNWSETERKLRELRACVAQSKLAISILFQDLRCAR